MESYQAANVIFVAIILWTAIKNSGKTIPEKTDMGFFINSCDSSSPNGSKGQTNAQCFSQLQIHCAQKTNAFPSLAP